ncbi:MAG TPA: response regulator transcription factor [Wenzhouxiangella sp.]|nr:response regulator transcription factor [Wenzhouxiangella sp.]
MARLLIADDHPLFRAALRQACATVVPDDEIAETTALDDTLQALARDGDIELVLLDLRMPGARGLSGLAALKVQFPALAVLVVSAHDSPRVIRRVLDHDAAGFISKRAASSEIRAAVTTVLEGGEWIPPDLTAAVEAEPGSSAERDHAARLGRLTPQQFRVLRLVADGLLNKQIADRLGIQERTVKAHVGAILEKLDVQNRTQASNILHRLDAPEEAL